VIDDLAIMDDDGNLLAWGEVGEIVHRGPNVMLGYYKDPNATEKSRAFGWHHTGDLGKIDPDGQLLFVDRKKDMIKSGGENVASIKVESVLLAHPAVANAAVVGLPHERWSEAVSAFVVLKPDQQTSAEEIIAFCRERLGDHEVPKAVIFIDALPLTQTGKVQKQALRQQYQRQFNENKRS
jgi:long-chain acyl-CoA synthetase